MHSYLLVAWEAALASHQIEAMITGEDFSLPSSGVKQLCHVFRLADSKAAESVIFDFISRTYA